MNPLQEYYLRNNVRTPYVFYGSSQVILHNPNRVRSFDRYKFFDVKAVNKEGNDGVNIGKFNITTLVPHRSSSLFIKDSEVVVYWHDFENHIVNVVSEWRSSHWDALSNTDELKIACWELFSYSNDCCFANLPITLLDLSFRAFDCSVPLGLRAKAVDEIIGTMSYYAENSYTYKSIVSSWNELINLVNSPRYAYWLVRLVKGGDT